MKDKLMELLNEMVQERNQTNTEIENQILDKTIKGLQVIRECLEYGKEMEKYFVMIEVPRIPIGRIMNSKIYFVFSSGVFEVVCKNCWRDYEHYTKNVFDKFTNETIAKQEKCYSALQEGARFLIDANFTLEEFQKAVNDALAEYITRYHQQTEKLKKNLSK